MYRGLRVQSTYYTWYIVIYDAFKSESDVRSYYSFFNWMVSLCCFGTATTALRTLKLFVSFYPTHCLSTRHAKQLDM